MFFFLFCLFFTPIGELIILFTPAHRPRPAVQLSKYKVRADTKIFFLSFACPSPKFACKNKGRYVKNQRSILFVYYIIVIYTGKGRNFEIEYCQSDHYNTTFVNITFQVYYDICAS